MLTFGLPRCKSGSAGLMMQLFKSKVRAIIRNAFQTRYDRPMPDLEASLLESYTVSSLSV